MVSWREINTADEALAYGRRVRDLEAEAFRIARAFAEHGDQLAVIREEKRTASGNTGSPGNAMGLLGERTIAERLDRIERILFALARGQGIDPGTAG